MNRPSKAPGVYAILAVAEIAGAAAVQQIAAKAGPSAKAGGGQYLASRLFAHL